MKDKPKMAKSNTGVKETAVQNVPSIPLVPRSAGGLGGALFQMLDELVAGKPVDAARINATCKIVGAYGTLVRTFIAQERFKATGAGGLTIEHASTGDASEGNDA